MPDAEHALILLAARLLIAVLLLALYRRRREAYLLYWTVAWVLLLVRYAAHLMWLGLGGSHAAPPGFEIFLLGFAALLFFDSARAFSRRAASPLATAFLAPVLVTWWALDLAFQPVALYLPLELGLAVVVLLTAWFFWRESRRREIFGGALLALALAVWGVTFLAEALRAWAPVGFVPDLEAVAMVAPQLVGISLLVVLYEDEKRLLERHMLGLAGLNLVTSSAQHAATVQDMLGLTLERVLGVLRMPAGAMVLALEGETHQFHIIHRGKEDFLRTVEDEGLFPYLRGLGARLGGLVVLPDLDRPERPPVFAHEEEFKKLRALARTAETRLLVVVSLRNKAGEAGLLLLTARESRRLNPAELRLLMGLGGQVGMAVENYRFMQQSTRRYGELRVLNEIGRALSSTRSVDELLERIHSEMGRVLDVSNFYIALYDRRKDEVTFELEVKDGAFLPKRSRRTRNGLTEYILRRKEPVLVRGNFQQTMAALGVEPGRRARSYCAVPILLHGEGVGVIGLVSYTDDNAFDEEHIGVLTILAAQAAVAIENAHLFAQEHQRSQQLSLLNNVSRKAISTLNPEEMLTVIASELH
ncbi:MAG: GAF domain-containing protein, partial [Terriglobia bacterium]